MEQSTPLAQSVGSRTHLLGVPPELRLQIYDSVIALSLFDPSFSCTTGQSGKSAPWSRGRPISLPVANLAMSCSQTANEVRAHLSALAPSESFVTISFLAGSLDLDGYFCIHRAPCPIANLTALKVIVDLEIDEHDLEVEDTSSQERIMELSHGPAVLRSELENLLHPGRWFGSARALTRVHILVQVDSSTEDMQWEEGYTASVQRIRTAYETQLRSDCLSGSDGTRPLE